MKYLFIFLFFTIINQVYAQKYQPLVEEGKYWIYGHYNTNLCIQMGQKSTEIRYFSGDTIIQGRSYKKLVSSFVPPNVLPYKIISKQSLCYMREDTLQRKVFLYNIDEIVFPCVDSSEVCIWDFSLQIGDTLPDCLFSIFNPVDFGEDKKYVVDSIKLMKNYFNLNLNHFYYHGIPPGICGDLSLNTVNFVEGFGMEDGPIYKRFGTYLINYCEGTLADCNIISSTKDFATNSNQLKIHPNPSNNIIHIDGLQAEANVQAQNINGQIIKTVTTIDSQVDISDIPSGLYIFEIQNKDVKERHKVVKI